MSLVEGHSGGPPMCEEDYDYHVRHPGRMYEYLDNSREVSGDDVPEETYGGYYDTLKEKKVEPSQT